MNDIKAYRKDPGTISELNRENNISETNNLQNNNNLKKKIIIISMSIFVLILIIVTIALLLKFKPWEKKPPNEESNTHNINFEEYMNELKFNTKVNDIKRLSIIQKSYDDMKINGINSQLSLFSQRDYDIYILSEKECNEENKKYCNKIYTGSIAMVSQCLSLEKEKCEPKIYVDLSNNNKTNLRNLNESIISDLKDIPITLCLFTLTDTNIITSISCPESLPQNIKDDLLSDLYYFRPLAQKSSYKKDQMNISIDNNIKKIGRKSTGLCDINNKINSFCDIDMIISKDSEGNLLSLNETSLSNIITDKLNGLNKNTITQLIDKTSQISSLNPDKYKIILNDLLDKLKPYMKYEEQFSMDILINNYINKKYVKKAVKNNKMENYYKIKRHLTNDDNFYLIKNQSLFNKEISGIKIDLNLKYDSGINVESMKTFSNLKFDDIEKELDNNIQFTNLNRAIKKLLSLSKAGNYLAYQLYEQLKKDLNNLTQEITIIITNLNSLVIYKDLTEMFDSTLSLNSLKILPIDIVEKSNNFIHQLNINLNEIENSDIDNYTNILNNNINYYFTKSLDYINNIFINLNILGNLLNSTKSKFAEIPNIYSNNTPTSYVNTIQEANNLYLNYGKTQYDIIKNEVESALTIFENNYYSPIQKQINIVNNINVGVQNKSFTIKNAKEEDYENLINNLNNSNIITNNIFNIIKDKITKIINKNEYKILDSDKDKYNIITNKSNEIAYKLDNDEIIDKIYDKIMINFKDNITDIIKYMDKIKEEKFTLIEDSLKEGLFKSSQKTKIKTDITNCAVNIINTVKRENEEYIKSIIDNIDEFIDENYDNLTSIIFDLNILLSESSIKELSILYEIALNSSINKIKNDILYNKKLIEEYYNEYMDILDDKVSFFDDELEDYSVVRTRKKITKGYLRKYNIYKDNILNIKQYLNSQLNNDLLDEYKNLITKIKEALQLIKNNKISEIYPSISKFSFNNKHINNIENINDIISKYFSLDIFNNNYLSILNNFKNEQNEELENITNIIENHNNRLIKLEQTEDESDDENDICLIFTFEMTMFGETFDFDTDDYCAKITSYFDNYKKLVDISIYFDKNIQKFSEKFEYILPLVNQKVNSYNSKINKIRDFLLYRKQDIINNNMTNDYLLPIKNTINLILSEKYGEKILNSSYNYYKNNIEGKIQNILNDINIKFNDSFYLLEQEMSNNLSKFKYSIEGFSYMCQILKDLIVKDIIFEYSDSIINLQKNELNYTISSYYNYLLQIVNSTYLYIINNIPTNEMNINTIIDLRKQEINEEFTKIIQNIIHSKNEVLNINNQLNILQIEQSNFFGLNSTLNDIISKLSKDLNNINENINNIYNNKAKDQFSIASNLYLENSLNGKNNKAIFEEIYDKVFIELNKEKFKQLLYDNWIFDQDYIINKLNISLFNLNKEILNEFLIVKRNYTSILEKEINNYFTKENILDKINNLFNNEIKNLNTTQLEEIQNNINETIGKIKEHLYNESQRLNDTLVSFTNDFSTINSTINAYKEDIYKEIKTLLYNIINKFKENMNKKVYNEYIEIELNKYITESKKYTKDLKQYNLLNSSYNLGEIIDNIIEDLVNEYKELVKRQIEYKYQMKLKDIYNMEELKTFINNEIDNEYNSNLFSVLKAKAIYNPGDIGYSEYDLNDIIKNDIKSTINTNINNINNIFLSIKGDNYEVNLSNSKNDINDDNWETLNFANINIKILEIKEYFEKFILSEQNYEKNYIDETVQNIIKENFINSLNNILLSFGIDFFEREIKYNQFFRISDLYDNLKYSITQSMSYYLNINTDLIKTLPKELKTKIINLNNIELLIEENNNYLINSVHTKIKDFIKNSKDYLINKYLEYMENEATISMNFNQELITIINNNLETIKNDIENVFTNSINSYLNEIFIYPYNNTLNEKKDKLIHIINEFRAKFIFEKGDLFTLESDNILGEINSQINITLDSINEYKSHLNLFKFPDELILYLNNYSINNIKPIYDEFKKTIDDPSDEQNMLNYADKDKIYNETYNSEIFVTYVNNAITNLSKNYIDNINNYLNNYKKDYSKNFSIEFYKLLDKYGRRLEEEDNKIYDKPIDEILGKLLNSSENSKIYVETLKELNDLKNIITKDFNKINIAFKESQKIIQDSNYEDSLKNDLYIVLEIHKNISINYYKRINESYYNIKQYLNESLLNIDNEIKNSINATYEILINEYKNFAEEEEPINVEYSKTIESLNPIYYNYVIGEKSYHITAKITNFQSYAKFKFGVEFENNDYRYPKIVASLINKSRPNNMKLDIFCYFGYCGKDGTILDINFNEEDYKMNLYFDIKSDNINVNTITNFDKYEYTLEMYTLEDDDEVECFTVAYIKFVLIL